MTQADLTRMWGEYINTCREIQSEYGEYSGQASVQTTSNNTNAAVRPRPPIRAKGTAHPQDSLRFVASVDLL